MTQPEPILSPTAPAFDRALRIEPAPEGHTVQIDAAWNVHRGPNGGYLAALLLQAATQSAAEPQRRPRVLTVHYLAVPQPGPAEIRTRLLRRGRSVSWLSADLLQQGQLCASAKVASSAELPSIEFSRMAPPPAPAADTGTVPLEQLPPFARHYEYRSAFGTPFKPGGADAVGGHIRLREPRPYDAPLIAALGDAWFPSTLALDTTPVMAATLDFTVHFRSHDALSRMAPDDFALSVFRSRRATEGFFEEDGELWSPGGELIAQTRQLALAVPVAT